MKAHATDFLFQAKRDITMIRMTWLQRITTSRWYEWASGILIILNSICIGWQTQYVAVRAQEDAQNMRPIEQRDPTFFLVLNAIFSVLFAIDLGLRWGCDGFIDFFRTKDVGWNTFDTVIVGFGLLDTLFEVITVAMDSSNDGTTATISKTANISLLRVLRVVRVVRVARVIRVMRFFRELRMMVFSIIGSMKSLMWVTCILGMMFYVFGISFTSATTQYLSTWEARQSSANEILVSCFGRLDDSVLTLFMAMSGGQDWGVYYEAVERLPALNRFLFIVFILFSIFAVVNVVTGIFVETAMQCNHRDREIVIHEELQAKETYLEQMRDVFEEMDKDGTGFISNEEFEKSLDDESVIAYFNFLKLDVSDASVLFELMDYDQSGEVSINEFILGCYKLQGESRSLDVKIMQAEVRFLKGICLEIHEFMSDGAARPENAGESHEVVRPLDADHPGPREVQSTVAWTTTAHSAEAPPALSPTEVHEADCVTELDSNGLTRLEPI